MTTPLMYLSFLVQKRYNNPELSSYIHNVEDFLTTQLTDYSKKDYISFFCQFNSFQDLFVSLFGLENMRQPHNLENIPLIEVVFQEKFPIDSSKLEKIWNLNPKGSLFIQEQELMASSDVMNGRGMFQFVHEFRTYWE